MQLMHLHFIGSRKHPIMQISIFFFSFWFSSSFSSCKLNVKSAYFIHDIMGITHFIYRKFVYCKTIFFVVVVVSNFDDVRLYCQTFWANRRCQSGARLIRIKMHHCIIVSLTLYIHTSISIYMQVVFLYIIKEYFLLLSLGTDFRKVIRLMFCIFFNTALAGRFVV
jgi:hypothetical protein